MCASNTRAMLALAGILGAALATAWPLGHEAQARGWYVHRTSHDMRIPPWYCYCYRMSQASILPGIVTYPMDMQITYEAALDRLATYATLPETCPANCGAGSGSALTPSVRPPPPPGPPPGPPPRPANLVDDPDFARFSAPGGAWGSGQYADRGIWWNSRGARSEAYTVGIGLPGHPTALYIRNGSRASAHVFGTTSQRIRVTPGRRYVIRVLAGARNLATRGALSIAVDPQWRVRPISIDSGTYDPREYRGTFTADRGYVDLQIIMQDRGEALLTGLEVFPE